MRGQRPLLRRRLIDRRRNHGMARLPSIDLAVVVIGARCDRTDLQGEHEQDEGRQPRGGTQASKARTALQTVLRMDVLIPDPIQHGR